MRPTVPPALRKVREVFTSHASLTTVSIVSSVLILSVGLAYLAVLIALLASPVFPWPVSVVDRLLTSLFLGGFIEMMSGLLALVFSAFTLMYLALAWIYRDGSSAWTGITYLLVAALCAYEFFTGTLSQLAISSLLPEPDYARGLEKALFASQRS